MAFTVTLLTPYIESYKKKSLIRSYKLEEKKWIAYPMHTIVETGFIHSTIPVKDCHFTINNEEIILQSVKASTTIYGPTFKVHVTSIPFTGTLFLADDEAVDRLIGWYANEYLKKKTTEEFKTHYKSIIKELMTVELEASHMLTINGIVYTNDVIGSLIAKQEDAFWKRKGSVPFS
jgi:hypothetical protein